MSRVRGDRGSVLLLVVGLFAVALLLVGVVVNVSAVILARRSLVGAADGAALSAAQALDEQVFYERGVAGGVPLSEQGVRERVAAYAELAAPGQPGLSLSGRVEDGYTAVVLARRTVTLPFGGWLDLTAVDLTAEARASSPLVETR